MPVPAGPTERRLADAILSAGVAASEDLASRLHEDGFADVRPGDWALLGLLRPGAVAVSKLAPPLGITPQATSKAVRDLERRDYVRRLLSLTDSRVHEVWLTQRGWRLFAAADQWAQEHQDRAIHRWGRDRVRTATSLLSGFTNTADRFAGPGRALRT